MEEWLGVGWFGFVVVMVVLFSGWRWCACWVGCDIFTPVREVFSRMLIRAC